MISTITKLPSVRLRINETDLCGWIGQAAPGDVLEYYRGFLALDTYSHWDAPSRARTRRTRAPGAPRLVGRRNRSSDPPRSAPSRSRRLQLSRHRALEAEDGSGLAVIAAVGGGRVMGPHLAKPRFHLRINQEVSRMYHICCSDRVAQAPLSGSKLCRTVLPIPALDSGPATVKAIEDATLDDIAFAMLGTEAEFNAVGDRLHALRKLYGLARQAGAPAPTARSMRSPREAADGAAHRHRRRAARRGRQPRPPWRSSARAASARPRCSRRCRRARRSASTSRPA